MKYYNQALPITGEVGDRSGEATIRNNMGLSYDNSGQPQEALKYYNQALSITREVGDRSGEAKTLNNMGAVYRSIGQPQQALKYYNQALPIIREVGDRAVEATTLNNMGAVYEGQGNSVEAIQFYQQSIEITESIQGNIQLDELKSSFASEQSNTYSSLINLLAEQGRFTDAFNYTERAKARAFLDQMANGQVNFRSGSDASLLQQEQDLTIQITAAQTQLTTLRNRPKDQWDQAAIAEAETRLKQLQRQYGTLLTQIKLQSPATASLVTVDVASLQEIQKLLEPDTTLVEYFVTGDRIFAFILTRTSFDTVTLNVSREDVVGLATLSHDLAGLDEAHPPALRQLHQKLVEPLQAYLNKPHLIIVPHDTLHYLPFAALTDGSPD